MTFRFQLCSEFLICNSLLPHLKGNVGLVFCKGDLADVRALLLENKVGITDSFIPVLINGYTPI